METENALSARLDWTQRVALRDALRQHPLVHIAAPRLTPAGLLELAAGLGTVLPCYRLSFRLPGYPQIMRVGNVRNEEGEIVSASAVQHGFHSDGAFREHPAEFTLLYAREVPARGGDTQFVSLYRLYEDLDPNTRVAWEPLQVEYETNSSYFDSDPDRSSIHALIQRHPDTGRRLVFASPCYMRRVVGLSETESKAILQRVADAIEPPDVAHHWRPNDLLVWDNRAVVHRATEFDPAEKRSLWRISVRLDG